MAKKLQLTYKEIEDRLRVFRNEPFQKEDIGYLLLWAFGKPEREIERYKEGKGVIKTFDGLLIKGLFCYKASTTLRFAGELDALKADPQVQKSAPKIIAVSDGQTIRAYDTRERNTFEQQVSRLFCDFEFFYPLAGVERVEYTEESPADIKAAEKLAKLHDEIRAYNEFTSDTDLHDLNTFIARLLFCFFAEDTGIFPSNSFTHAIQQYSHDGITLKDLLEQLFRFMGGKPLPEGALRTYCLDKFAFVGGGLFERDIYIPQLSFKARQIIMDSGELDWQDINPDIFGSMIQAVVNPDVRANQGMHYTSVPNIMKVINPLFMDELREQYQKILNDFEKVKQQKELGVITQSQMYAMYKPVEKACNQLMLRMSKMKFFDPACGSGNFLIITYKMLRLLEMDILRIKTQCSPQGMLEFIDSSCITLKQFYGIELLDFPHEVAMLSLWLAEHQMNKKMHDNFGVNTQALPLKDINNIRCGNACRVDWNEVCPHTKDEEVFVFGNPPYLGSRNQESEQKEDLDLALSCLKDYRKLDYIAIWFWLAHKYIKDSKSACAFVSTNSITQGEQVLSLWKPIFDDKIEIGFAYTSFAWANNARNNAHVIVVIINLRNTNTSPKTLYTGDEVRSCVNINGYLSNAENVFIENKRIPISDIFPPMIYGSEPREGGYLMLEPFEKVEALAKDKDSEKFIKPITGSNEYINSIERYCFWIKDEDMQEAILNPYIANRLEKVSSYRLTSKRADTVKYSSAPNRFTNSTYQEKDALVVPVVSSAKRKYLPLGFVDKEWIILNSAQVVYNCSLVAFGTLESYIHMIWVKAVSGKLKNDIRYSSTLCYNTFPFPSISDAKRNEIEEAATDILLTREPYLTMGKTLADLYDPDTMPADLKAAHERLDSIVESCYPGAPFASDEARLECLFKLYEKMTSKNK